MKFDKKLKSHFTFNQCQGGIPGRANGGLGGYDFMVRGRGTVILN